MKDVIIKILKEEFDSNDLGWADEVSELDINVGDVYYIIDGGDWNSPPLRDDYKPKNTRYVLVINDIKDMDGEIYVYKNLCNNYNTSYNPKDYTIEKCLNYTTLENDYLRLDRALDLINKKYWRYMGNSKY